MGVANHLARRTPKLGSPDFGKSFEHYVLMELRVYQVYRQPDLDIWRQFLERLWDGDLGVQRRDLRAGRSAF